MMNIWMCRRQCKLGPYSSRCSVVEAEIWTLLSLLPWMWLGFLLSKEETQIS